MRTVFQRLIERSLSLLVRSGEEVLGGRRNVDVVLSAAWQRSDLLMKCHDPVAFVQFLRSCIEPTAFSIRGVKGAIVTYAPPF